MDCRECRPDKACWRCLADSTPCPSTRKVARAWADIECALRDVHDICGDAIRAKNTSRVHKTAEARFQQSRSSWHASIRFSDGTTAQKRVKLSGPLSDAGKAACLRDHAADVWYLPAETWQTCFHVQSLLDTPVRPSPDQRLQAVTAAVLVPPESHGPPVRADMEDPAGPQVFAGQPS